jgi:hypothetical protein
MEHQTLRFQQIKAGSWVTEKLSDGSMAVFDQASKDAYFLNASAAAAWSACAEPASAPQIARAMETALNMPVTAETVLIALADLEEKHLVESSAPAALAGRRSALKKIAMTAGAVVPVVLAMTAAEQKAFAQGAGSAAPSDMRLKEDRRRVARVFGLNLYTFRFTGSSVTRMGLMAQEVYEQYPEAVIRGGADPVTEPWKIDYAKLVRLLGDPQAYVLAELARANS